MTPPPQIFRSASPALPVSFTINRAGEMPPNAMSPKLGAGSLPKQSPMGTPARSNTPSRLVPPSVYPTYDVGGGDELPRTNTPEMIKVTRTKKKKSATDGASKKKRTKDVPAVVDQANGSQS